MTSSAAQSIRDRLAESGEPNLEVISYDLSDDELLLLSTFINLASSAPDANASLVKRRFDDASEAVRKSVGVLGVDAEFDAAVREYKIARYEFSNELAKAALADNPEV